MADYSSLKKPDSAITDRRRPPGAKQTALNDSAHVMNLQRTAQLLNRGSSDKNVIQRVVLTKFTKLGTRYYSDLSSGKTDYATYEEAKKEDDELSKDQNVLNSKLFNNKKKKGIKRKKKSKNRDFDKPKRTPTPYSHDLTTSVSAKPKVSRQGPHFLSFSSTEYRLQNRLRDTNDNEIKEKALQDIKSQILLPETFKSLVDFERPEKYKNINWDGSNQKKRMISDYTNLYKSFEEQMKSGPHDVGSHFHLTVKSLMQLHPYTTYGVDKKSSGNGERKKSRMGSNSIDKNAKFKSQENAEDYLAMRSILFHESDTESDTDRHKPFDFQHRKDDRPKPSYTRKSREKRQKLEQPKPTVNDSNLAPPEDEKDN